MASNITAGIDMTTEPPSIYISIDGRITRFRNSQEAHEFFMSLCSVFRHFIHPDVLDNPGDRQLLRRRA